MYLLHLYVAQVEEKCQRTGDENPVPNIDRLKLPLIALVLFPKRAAPSLMKPRRLTLKELSSYSEEHLGRRRVSA